MKRHRIQFPLGGTEHLDQDEVSVFLHEATAQILCDRLKCQSQAKVASILKSAVGRAGEHSSTLRRLDLGAGNGIMGEELRRLGVARLMGTDIIQEAADAYYRDRPGVYDDYDGLGERMLAEPGRTRSGPELERD